MIKSAKFALVLVLMFIAIVSSAQSGETVAILLKNGDVRIGGASEATSDKQHGYYNITSVALLFGQGQNGFLPIPSLTMVNGWQISPKLYTGLGIGYEYYEWSVMPLFADVKYMFVSAGTDKLMPFCSMKLGWAFPLGKPTEEDSNYDGITKYQGGIQLNPEAGIRISMGNNSALLLSMGYHFQQLSYKSKTYYWWNSTQYESTTHTDYNRITFRLGFRF